MAPRDTRDQPGDAGGGFVAPRVFDTLEEAVAAGTAEDEYLENLDKPDDEETDQ
jgi:hypothetical protein